MGGERPGWNNWRRYLEAGIVDKTIHFTQEEVIRDHALGKTADTVGMCWPMDAAVAYTLASAGPDANLTSKQMVNQYTKMAFAMMSQMVGYGTVPDPRKDSCGHDMIEGYLTNLTIPKLNNNGHIEFSYDGAPLITWHKLDEELQSLCVIRTSKGEAANLNTCEGFFRLLNSKKYTPLRLFLEETLGSTNWSCNFAGFPQSATSGECLWKDNPDKHCAHHDKPTYTGWVMIKQVDMNGNVIPNRFVKMWSRDRYQAAVWGGWNHDQVERNIPNASRLLAPERVVLWDTVKRNLASSVDKDPKQMKECIKSINESLRRMSARNFNVVTKEGLRNNATYNWKEWDWLYNLENWVAQTSKKGRKEGDTICPKHNPLMEISSCDKVGCKEGWVFTKYGAKQSYGHEIASFKWVPTEMPKVYYVNVRGKLSSPYGMYYYSNNNQQANIELIFSTREKAEAFRTFAPMMGDKTGGVGMWERVWDAETGKEISSLGSRLTVKSAKMNMEMAPEADPEETPTPQELLEALKFGSPQQFDTAIKYLHEPEKHLYVRPTIKEAKKEVEQNV